MDDDKEFEEFEKRLSQEGARGYKERIEDSPPIGMGPDGELNTGPGKPKIITASDDEDDDLSDLDDIEAVLEKK